MQGQLGRRPGEVGPRWRFSSPLGWIVVSVTALGLLLGLGSILADPDAFSTAPRGPVIISEFVAAGSTSTFAADGELGADGDPTDWIELHNRSLRPVNLTDWTLTDDPTQPDKWRFGNVTLAPDEYLIVYASGEDQRKLDADHPHLHTNFRLDADGGYLALLPPTSARYLQGTRYDYPSQVPGVSYGLAHDPTGQEAPRYLEPPTPGAPNTPQTTWAAVLPPVQMSVAHGFFTDPFSVTLTSPTPGATIRYTVDGSTPTPDNGSDYLAPIPITRTTPLRAVALRADDRPSFPTTQSYLRLDDVLTQPAQPTDWPATWGIHRIDMGPYRAGEPVEADYAMDARIVDDPSFGPQVRAGLTELPTLSLVLDPAELAQIYADPQTRGPAMERPVSVEWIDPNDADAGFQVNAGLRIQGGAGRWEFMPKHSFRLFFKQQYGANKLDYPLFATSPITSFNTLTLRAGSDDSFAGHPSTADVPVDHRQATYLADEWARRTQLAMSPHNATGGKGVHGEFVHLYLNGLYWGVYNVVERPDAAFAASYGGGDRADWSAASHAGPVDGPQDRINVLIELAQAGGLADPAAYATFLEFIDPAEFADYLLLNWYAGNWDWPENNWYINVQNPAGRNTFILWDGESTWVDGAKIQLGGPGWEGTPYPNVIKLIFDAAWANPDFRQTLADRLYFQVTHGALTDAAAAARWQTLQATLADPIAAEAARWGDVRHPDAPITPDDWQAANARILAQMPGNGAKLIEQARALDYYPPIDPPTLTPHSGDFHAPLTVTVTAEGPDQGDARIYITTDGTDPRAPGDGSPAPSAQRYVAPLLLTTTTTLQARQWVDGVWSALERATFAAAGEAGRLVISEIMYHPYLDGEMEFLELANVGNAPLDLGGAFFTGIDYRFAQGATLGAGERLVLVGDLKKFRRRYADAPVFGIYAGKLSDKGETLTLYHPDRTVWLQVQYDDARGWPLSADGAGDALVIRDPAEAGDDPHNWRASEVLYGTPGLAEPDEDWAVATPAATP
jgi:hypothetical protein